MIKQTRNAMHMLFAAYIAVYKQAMSKGTGIRCSAANTLKLLLIISSIGCAYADRAPSTSIITPYAEKSLNGISTAYIDELSLVNNSDVNVSGNLGSQTAFMIQEHVSGGLEESLDTYNGSYQNALALMNKADFQNITNKDVFGAISVNSVTVDGGLARFELNGNQNFTVTGETNVSAGLLHLDANTGTSITFGNAVTYSGKGTGHLSGTVNLSSIGMTIKDQAALDLGKTTINGNINVQSKGVVNSNGFSDLENQYGVWGTSVNNFIANTPVNGGIQVGHKAATINGKLNIDGGRVVVGDFDDYSSSNETPALTVTDKVTVKNGGEIKVLGVKDYPAQLTMNDGLEVSGNGSLVTVGNTTGNSGAALNVTGTTTVNDGGRIVVGRNGKATFNGDTNLEGKDSITTNGNGLVTFNGKTSIKNWKTVDNTTDISIEGEATLDGADIVSQTLTAKNDTKIYHTSIETGKTVCSAVVKLDPSSLSTSTLEFEDNGKLAVLSGSAVYVGDKSNFGSTGTVAEGKALLALASGINIGNTNAVYLDGSKNNDNVGDIAANTFTLKSGTTLDLYGGAFSKGAAVTFTDGNGTFTVEDGSKIVLKGRQTTGKNTIVTGANGINTPSDWKSYLSSGNILYQINDVTADNGQYVVDLGISSSGVAAVSGGISSALSRAIISQANGSGTDSSKNNGLGLISQMIENIGTGSEEEVSRFRDEANSVTGFIFGGVPLLNVLVAQVAHDNIEQHNGFSSAAGSNHTAVKGTNATVWAMPFYKHSKSDSFKIEGSTYGLKAKIYGLSMGTDFEVADGFRLGFDGLVGHAKTDSQGSLDPSKDDASFWGLGTYGSYNYENLKVMADIGYTEMNTDTDLFTSYGTLSSSNTKSYTITAGVNAKYSFVLTYADVAPHAGIRFNHANIDKYKVKRQGEVLMTGDSISQNYFQFPVGVEVSKQFACGEWNLKPMFDLTATINTGDKKLDAKATLTGFDNNYGNVSTRAEVLDSVSVRGSLGLEASYGALGLGAGYSYTGSENVKDHVFAAGVNYTF